MVRCANVSDFGTGSSTGNLITHVNFLCCGYVWKTGKPPGSLENLCSFPPCQFVQPILPRFVNLVPDFTICSTEFPYTNGPKNISSITRSLSHKWKVRIFLLFAIIIFKNNIKKKKQKAEKAFRHYFGVFRESVTYEQHITYNLLDDPQAKSIFFVIFILRLRNSRK